jgi:hypothetical protein
MSLRALMIMHVFEYSLSLEIIGALAEFIPKSLSDSHCGKGNLRSGVVPDNTDRFSKPQWMKTSITPHRDRPRCILPISRRIYTKTLHHLNHIHPSSSPRRLVWVDPPAQTMVALHSSLSLKRLLKNHCPPASSSSSGKPRLPNHLIYEIGLQSDLREIYHLSLSVSGYTALSI